MKALAVVPMLIALAAAACGAAGPQSAGPAPKVALPAEPAAAPVSARPKPPRVGFIGLPPEGAIPSLPLQGELAARFWAFVPGQGTNYAWLYEDGRLIWFRQVNRPYGANRIVTGYLEQRLTPRGVESIRSELLSTGLFRLDMPLPRERPPAPDQSVQVEVRDGDRLRSNGRLSERNRRHFITLFTELGATLPAAFWADRTIRAYVPSKFAFCYLQENPARPPLERSELLSVLPAPAEELLGSRAPFGQYDDGYCWELTTREARAIATPLSRIGLKPWAPNWVLGFGLAGAGFLQFEPMLPDGGWLPCSPCG
jgi:hypothetical protein